MTGHHEALIKSTSRPPKEVADEDMPIYDQLSTRVQQALGDALAPWPPYLFVGIPEDVAIEHIRKWDREQHVAGAMLGLVARRVKPFKLTPLRERRRRRDFPNR